MGWLAWHAIHGPSADQLFSQIEKAADSRDAAGLREVRTAMRDFLDRFPEDRRHEQVQRWNDQLQQQGLRRKVEKSSRTLKGEGARSPMQRAYNDALELRP